MLSRCKECGSLATTVKCIRIRKDICRSCCDTDCPEYYSCWGRYY